MLNAGSRWDGRVVDFALKKDKATAKLLGGKLYFPLAKRSWSPADGLCPKEEAHVEQRRAHREDAKGG
jgi:hypothetical protein